MTVDDATFLRMTRPLEEGGLNPGRALEGTLGEQALDTADMRQNLALLYALAVGLKAGRILEIGTSDGTSTLALLKAAEETRGQVVSIDLDECPVAHKLVDQYGLAGSWRFLRGPSQEILPTLVAEGLRFDLILVDGGHTYEDARRDVETADTLLREEGVLCTHDNWMMAADVDWSRPFGERATPGCGIWGREMLLGKEWIGLVLPFGYQLGIFRRRRAVIAEMDAVISMRRQEGLIR